MKLSTLVRTSLLTVALATVSCAPFKSTSSKVEGESSHLMNYTIQLEKDASDYLEIVEVKLMNSENKQFESASFRVLQSLHGESVLNLKGYDSFVITASTGNLNLNPDAAIIVYKNKPDGDLKSRKVKPLFGQE